MPVEFFGPFERYLHAISHPRMKAILLCSGKLCLQNNDACTDIRTVGRCVELRPRISSDDLLYFADHSRRSLGAGARGVA